MCWSRWLNYYPRVPNFSPFCSTIACFPDNRGFFLALLDVRRMSVSVGMIFFYFYEYFSFSLTWDPIGAKSSKRYSYKSHVKLFKLSWIFSPVVLTTKRLGFLKFWKLKFKKKNFSYSLTRDSMGVKMSKRFSYKSKPKGFKLVLNFPPNGPHKTTFGIFKILSFRFLTIFFSKISNSPLQPMAEIKKPQLSGKRALVNQNGVKCGTRG